MEKKVKYVLFGYEKIGFLKDSFTFILYNDQTLLEGFQELENKYGKENFVITRIFKDND